MSQYLIYPTEQEALDRSHEAHETDTMRKMRTTKSGLPPDFVTQYRWATDVGADGQTALVIDGDVSLLTADEVTKLVPKLPDAEGENWYKPPPEVPTSELAETA